MSAPIEAENVVFYAIGPDRFAQRADTGRVERGNGRIDCRWYRRAGIDAADRKMMPPSAAQHRRRMSRTGARLLTAP